MKKKNVSFSAHQMTQYAAKLCLYIITQNNLSRIDTKKRKTEDKIGDGTFTTYQ